MRRCFLVCYDICDQKRLHRVYSCMKGFGEHWQYSVFFCVLKSIDRIRMQRSLEKIMNLKEDQVVIVDLGPNAESARRATVILGPALDPPDEGTVVV